MGLFKTDIANLALGYLGVSLTVSDLNDGGDNSQQAKIIRRNFQSSLESILEHYPWGFATKMSALELVEENPTGCSHGFSYKLPSDSQVIQKIDYEGNLKREDDYEDERVKFEESYDETHGTLILTDLGDAWAKYTVRLDDGLEFPNHFGKGLAAQLALDIAPQIITNNFAKVQNVLVSDARRRINDAIAADLNRKPRPATSDSRFVRVR